MFADSKIKRHTSREETNRKSRNSTETDRNTDTKETERHPNKQTDIHIDRQAVKQKGRLKVIQKKIDRQAGRQTSNRNT